MPKYYRYLAPAEIQFYGLDPASQFIITRRIKFEVGLRHVTVPKGYVCRGVGLSYQDFCVPPRWAAYEHMYATHRTDRAVCTREEADLFLFNAYPDDMNLVGDELFCGSSRSHPHCHLARDGHQIQQYHSANSGRRFLVSYSPCGRNAACHGHGFCAILGVFYLKWLRRCVTQHCKQIQILSTV